MTDYMLPVAAIVLLLSSMTNLILYIRVQQLNYDLVRTGSQTSLTDEELESLGKRLEDIERLTSR